MLETLQALSGTTHRSYRDNKSVTLDARRQFNQADSKVTMSTSVKEMPVISKNDMLLVPKGNMMIFGKGYPIWNRNQTSMPFAFALHKNELRDFDHNTEYTLATVPTAASTSDFDILGNQPDFFKMVTKRVDQARLSAKIRQRYKEAYGKPDHPLTEFDLKRIDTDVLADQLMAGINEQYYLQLHPEKKNDLNNGKDQKGQQVTGMDQDTQDIQNMTDEETMALAQLANAQSEGTKTTGQDLLERRARAIENAGQENTAVIEATNKYDRKHEERTRKIYGGGRISREDFDTGDTRDNVATAYVAALKDIQRFGRDQGFIVDNDGSLIYNGQVFIRSQANSLQALLNSSNTLSLPGSQSKAKVDPAALVEVTPQFISWIVQQDSLARIGSGVFDNELGRAFVRRENMSISRDAV